MAGGRGGDSEEDDDDDDEDQEAVRNTTAVTEGNFSLKKTSGMLCKSLLVTFSFLVLSLVYPVLLTFPLMLLCTYTCRGMNTWKVAKGRGKQGSEFTNKETNGKNLYSGKNDDHSVWYTFKGRRVRLSPRIFLSRYFYRLLLLLSSSY